MLVPGPDPAMVFSEETLRFLRQHYEWKGNDGRKTDILSVCTGCLLLGQSGILNGKNASGPRAIVPKLQKMFPDTKWVGDKRWVKDGNIWTSGGFDSFVIITCLFPAGPLSSLVNEADSTHFRWHHEWARNGSSIHKGKPSWPCI